MRDQLYLGAAQADITPEVGGRLCGYRPDIFSVAVHDNLFVKTLAFSYGETKVLMMCADVAAIATPLCDILRRELSDTYGIPLENIIISSTHTHTGPQLFALEGIGDFDVPYYENIFHPAVLHCSREALDNMEAVTMGFGIGKSDVAVNRRNLDLENVARLSQCPWGPYNPYMKILSFKNSDGDIKANLVSYSCHGTCAGADPYVSRDWSGVMVDALSSVTGGISAFFNGAIGDTGPRIPRGGTTGNIKDVDFMGSIAAEDALRIYNSIEEYKPVELEAVNTMLKLPLLPRLSYEEATAKYEAIAPDAINWQGMLRAHYKKVIDSYENGYEDKEYKEVPQTIVRIGPVAFATFPYELFSAIDMRINHSFNKFFYPLHVISLSYANGQELYFPTQDQLCYGGYEVNCSTVRDVQPHPDDVDYHLFKETIRNLNTLEIVKNK